MRLLIDTNRLTDALRGEPEAVAVLESADAVEIPFIVAGELKAGFLAGSRTAANELLLAKLLLQPQVTLRFADRETLDVYARLYAYLRRQGTPVPANDLWIAALAVQHQLTLFTRDRHFELMPQVSLWR